MSAEHQLYILVPAYKIIIKVLRRGRPIIRILVNSSQTGKIRMGRNYNISVRILFNHLIGPVYNLNPRPELKRKDQPLFPAGFKKLISVVNLVLLKRYAIRVPVKGKIPYNRDILYNLQKYLYKTLDKLKREEYIKLIKKKYQGRVLGYGP